MKRLQEGDGSDKHIKAGNYHIGACQQGEAPVHRELEASMTTEVATLKTKQRARIDAEEEAVKISAAADVAEVKAENVVRDLEDTINKVDRNNPELGIRLAVLPNGFGPIIDPEGDDQLEPLRTLRTKLVPFEAIEAISLEIAKLDPSIENLRTKLDAEDAALTRVETLKTEEKLARSKIREQFEDAYGKLRSHYKAAPGFAERFFLREIGSRKKNPTPT